MIQQKGYLGWGSSLGRWGTCFGIFLRFLWSWLVATPVWSEERYVLLTLLHTNDLHGRIVTGTNLADRSRGGLARAGGLIKSIRQQMPYVLLLDSGDLIHGTPEVFLSKGRSIIEVMNLLGYDAGCPGNHEFDWSAATARRVLSGARFPWVSANLRDATTGSPWGPCQEYVIKPVGPLKVAIFGLTTLQTLSFEWPSFLQGVRFDDPLETARRLVPRLRQEADLVILLSHLGLQEDLLLVSQVPGIDVLLGGHSHSLLPQPLVLGQTVILHSGAYGEYLGRLDLILQQDRQTQKYSIVSVNGWRGRWWADMPHPPLGVSYPRSTTLPLDSSLAPDGEVLQVFAPYEAKTEEILNQKLGQALEEIGDEGAPGDTPLARVLADLLRQATGTEIALVDGKWRGRLPQGPLRVRDLWEACDGYTAQNVVIVQVKGSALKSALEQWASSPQGLAIGLSGALIEYNLLAPEGERIRSVWVNGKALEEEIFYRLSAPAYVLRRFPSLQEGWIEKDQAGWTRILLEKALKKVRILTYPSEPRLREVGG